LTAKDLIAALYKTTAPWLDSQLDGLEAMLSDVEAGVYRYDPSGNVFSFEQACRFIKWALHDVAQPIHDLIVKLEGDADEQMLSMLLMSGMPIYLQACDVIADRLDEFMETERSRQDTLQPNGAVPAR
jgi:hypothetical protein